MEFFQVSPPYYHANNQQFTLEKRHLDTKTDHFIVDDLLDFPTDNTMVEGCPFVADTSTDSSTAIDSCNSSSQCGGTEPSLAGEDGCPSFVDNQFSNLCVPYDDLAEFEWLSKFVEESFSNEDMQKLQLISGLKAQSEHAPQTLQFHPRTINQTNNSIFNSDMTIPSKARTKRSRITSCKWASQLPVMSPTVTRPTVNMSSNSKSDIVSNSIEKNKVKTPLKDIHDNLCSKNEDGRKCLHCATNKTPQWRTGPMGPRTLCNACGVRYKSGRLVPEYRPAASPTFILTKHSNSHRKVLELRKQKLQKSQYYQQQILNNQQDIMLQMPNSDDYLIHQHINLIPGSSFDTSLVRSPYS